MDQTADEIKRLQGCINDLISVLALPALWSGYETSQIVSTLLDVLLGMLRLDFAYARLSAGIDDSPIEVVRVAQRRHLAGQPQEAGRALSPWLTGDPPASPFVVPNPVGEGEVTIAPFRLGLQEEVGVVVAGSQRADFPTVIERLLLRVAANQAAMGLQEARRLSEQRRAAEELERRVVERTGQLTAVNEELRREIIERERAEEQREQLLTREQAARAEAMAAQQRFRDLVNSVDGIVWEADAETFAFSFVNEQAERILGYPLEQWLNEPTFWPDHLHPDDRDWAIAFCVRATAEKRNHDFEYRMVAADGHVVWLRDLVTVVFEGDRATKLRGVMVDITARKRAEEERQAHLWFLESMDKVNLAMQGTNDLEQMMSDVLDGVLSIFNGDRAWLVYPCDPEVLSWRALMEHTRPEFPGAFALGFDLPVDEDIAKVFQAARAARGPVRFDPGADHPVPAQLIERFGVQSLLAMAIYPKVDKPYLFGLHQCSYPRVWTPQEERLFQAISRRLEDALTSLLMFRNLRESEAKLEEAQRIAHVGYWERDLDTDLITWSEETYRIFGLPPQERTINFAGLQELTHPDDRQIMVEAVAEALRGGPRYDVEYRVVRPGGEVRIVHSQGEVTRDETGRPRRVFGTAQDITERKEAEEQLTQVTQELIARNQELWRLQGEMGRVEPLAALGRVTGTIAHELGTPLNSVLGYTQLLAQETLPDGARESLQIIETQTQRMIAIIQQYLSHTRRALPRHQPLDLNGLVRETLVLLKPIFHQGRVQVRTALADALPFPSGDGASLQRVLINVLTNAVDAMESGGEVSVTTQLSAGAEQGRGGIVMEVRDTGRGIAPELLPRLFDLFVTTKAPGKGTGLGLAVCQEIIKAHGGTITIASQPRAGTCVRLFLPTNVGREAPALAKERA